MVSFITAVIMVLIGSALPAAAQSGRTFYIDYASGSNSNPGTKASPWKTHPYMQTAASCTGSGSTPSYSHQAGDHFIFKGGVSWPVGCFNLSVKAGGTSGSPDYYGVDSSWFAGSSFTRPLFDLNFSVPSGNDVIETNSLGNIVFDNFEIRNQGIAGSCSSACGGSGGTQWATQAAFEFLGSSNMTVKNSYIHDWVTTHTGNCNNFLNYSAGAIFGATLVDTVEISGENSWYGPSHTPLTFGGGIQEPPGTMGTEVRNSKIHGTMAGCFSIRSCHDNELYHITSQHGALDGCPHSQVVESDDAVPDTIYNNLIHDNGGAGQGVGVVIYECARPNIYNNVMYNNNAGGGNGHILIGDTQYCASNGGSSSDVANVYNNTLDCSNGVYCVATDSKGSLPGTINLENNIFITNGSNAVALQSGVAKFNSSNNYTMSTSEASTYGFTSARKYAPSSSNPNVSSKTVNLLNLATGSLAALAYDAAGAPWYGGSYVPRTQASDLGAFVHGGQSISSSPSKPNPPSNLAANVQ
jgi:hypothetical protein